MVRLLGPLFIVLLVRDRSGHACQVSGLRGQYDVTPIADGVQAEDLSVRVRRLDQLAEMRDQRLAAGVISSSGVSVSCGVKDSPAAAAVPVARGCPAPVTVVTVT